MTETSVEQLRQCAAAVYLHCDRKVTDDLAKAFYAAADEIERLTRENTRMSDVHCHLLNFLRTDLGKVVERYEDLSKGALPKGIIP